MSPFGVHDLARGVREWTLDFFEPYGPDEALDPSGPKAGTWRALRGGSDIPTDRLLPVFYRQSAPPDATHADVGFRCALEAFRSGS